MSDFKVLNKNRKSELY